VSEWFGALPERWEQRKIKYLFSERIQKGYPDEPLLVASQNMGVVPKGVYGSRTVEATKDLHLLKLVEIGDFVISLRSFQGGIEYAYYRGIISPAYTIMIPCSEMTAGYFRHFAKSFRFIELLRNTVTGIREGQNINYEKLKNEYIPLPPCNEQDQIVRYLDWKVSRVNTLINAHKRQVALLCEAKQAAINEAVTKGGEGWSKDFFSKIATVCANLVSPNKYLDYPQVSPANIEKDSGRILPCVTVRETGIISDNHLFFEGQILYSKIRPLLNKVTIAPFDGLCSADMYPIETQLYAKYLVYFMLSTTFLSQLSMTENRVKMPKLNRKELASIIVIYPSINEQRAIVARLDEQCAIVARLDEQCGKIDRLIVVLEREVALLAEYRTRLVSDVVTGKVDVRGVVVPEYERVDAVSEAGDTGEAQEEGGGE
jgi:type I restriction enzyme S subunit